MPPMAGDCIKCVQGQEQAAVLRHEQNGIDQVSEDLRRMLQKYIEG